jgi:hypothetical protein
VKRVLLDENLPRKLRRDLLEYVVRTVQEEGWTSFRNGELLTRAQHVFDVLLTADRRHEIRAALATVRPGQIIQVQVSKAPGL